MSTSGAERYEIWGTLTTSISPARVSQYLEYLPAIFQQDADERGVNFIGRFLLAFEMILSGLGDPEQPGLEETIDRLHTYFDPGGDKSPDDPSRAPAEFLPWLGNWVALGLRQDWAEEETRRLISRIVPVYRQRGTRAGLMEALRAYLGTEGVEIHEFHQSLQVGVTSTLDADAMIDGGPPHYFLVKLLLDTPDPYALSRKTLIARAIIDQEKPAHTYYDLQVEVPTMQIEVYSTVGVDTLLGTEMA